MVEELEGLQAEVAGKEQALASARRAAAAAQSALEAKGKADADARVGAAAAALERQKDFVRSLEGDIERLQGKQSELADAAARVVRRRGGEVEAAGRRAAAALKKEREAWVAAEKQRLGKLAKAKAGDIKDEVRACVSE